MKLSELPEEIQHELRTNKPQFIKEHTWNNSYHLCLINKNGTRYFRADRICLMSKWAAFGGGSYWKIHYGCVVWTQGHTPFGDPYYHWKLSCKAYGSVQMSNGSVINIPRYLDTKKEVIEIARKIGFEI